MRTIVAYTKLQATPGYAHVSETNAGKSDGNRRTWHDYRKAYINLSFIHN